MYEYVSQIWFSKLITHISNIYRVYFIHKISEWNTQIQITVRAHSNEGLTFDLFPLLPSYKALLFSSLDDVYDDI